jgi:heme-degrading monooxygenase HmoA
MMPRLSGHHQRMIIEQAMVTILSGKEAEFELAFAEAKEALASAAGFGSVTLLRCVERPSGYLFLIEWDSLEDHMEGFRGSSAYERWRDLLHGFYEPSPTVEHFAEVARR